MFAKKHLYYLLGASLLFAIGLLAVANRASHAQGTASQAILLPQQIELEHSGPITSFALLTHPLTQDTSPGSPYNQVTDKTLYAYTKADGRSGFLPDEQVYVGHWLYTYPSNDVAERALEIYLQQMSQAENAPHLTIEDIQVGEATGKMLIAIDPEVALEEQESVTTYWIVSRDGAVLSLIMVEGLGAEFVGTAVEKLVGVPLNP